jgi:pimeloyl-ACP methyl ester carboxylesterase
MEVLRTAGVLLGLGALLYLVLCAALYLFRRSLLYFPQPARGTASSMALCVPGAELQVSLQERSGSRAVLYFGGNAEDVSASLPELAADFPDQSVYALHYRGYGRSTGQATEAALQSDALALFDHIALLRTDITVVGRSLGSGLAVSLAAQRTVSRLVLVTPYDSIEAVAAQHYPLFPVRWLIHDRFDAAALAPRVRAPTTVIVAERDEVIPRARTDALVSRFAPGVASVVVVPGAGHNTLDGRPDYNAALAGRP